MARNRLTEIFLLPDRYTISYAPTDGSCAREVSAHLNTRVDRFIPADCEKQVGKGEILSHQFNLDVHRALYQIVLSDGQAKKIKCERELIEHVGLTDAKRISEVATQAHIALPLKIAQNTLKDENHFLSQQNMSMDVRIVKTEDDDYVIKSSIDLQVLDMNMPQTIPGIRLYISRTTTLGSTANAENSPKDDFTMIVHGEIANS